MAAVLFMDTAPPFSFANPFVYLTAFFLFIGAILANAAGIGGGAVYVAALMFIGGFSVRDAVPLSKAIIFTGSLVSLYINSRNRHPLYGGPVINMEILKMIVPMSLGGTLIGVFCNGVFPEGLTVMCLFAILIIVTYRTFESGIRTYKAENELILEPVFNEISLVSEKKLEKIVPSVSQQEATITKLKEVDTFNRVSRESQEMNAMHRLDGEFFLNKFEDDTEIVEDGKTFFDVSLHSSELSCKCDISSEDTKTTVSVTSYPQLSSAMLRVENCEESRRPTVENSRNSMYENRADIYCLPVSDNFQYKELQDINEKNSAKSKNLSTSSCTFNNTGSVSSKADFPSFPDFSHCASSHNLSHISALHCSVESYSTPSIMQALNCSQTCNDRRDLNRPTDLPLSRFQCFYNQNGITAVAPSLSFGSIVRDGVLLVGVLVVVVISGIMAQELNRNQKKWGVLFVMLFTIGFALLAELMFIVQVLSTTSRYERYSCTELLIQVLYGIGPALHTLIFKPSHREGSVARQVQMTDSNEERSFQLFTSFVATPMFSPSSDNVDTSVSLSSWTPTKCAIFAIIATFGGICSGLFGIGGGLIFSPLFVFLNIDPVISVATAATCVAFTSASTTFQYLFIGRMRIIDAIFYGSFTVVAGGLGVKLLFHVSSRYWRRSYIILLVAVAVAVSSMLTIIKAVFLINNA